jgi:hypothetical protein
LRDHTYEYDKIVIGSSVSALLYSYFNNIPAIFTNIEKPKFFERFSLNVDFNHLGLNTADSNQTIGIPKYHIWGRLVYLLSYAGLLPLSDKAISIRLEDESILRVATEYSRFAKFKFNELLVFNDDNFHGIKSKNSNLYEVLDWMNVRSGTTHRFDRIENTSNFVKCVHFYPSDRIDGAHNKKDLVAVSHLTEEQLADFNYSDTYARFVVEDLMKKNGIKGRRNGRDTNNPNLYRYYSIKVETAKREINNIKHLTSPSENVIIMRSTDEELLQQYSGTNNQYIQKLLKYFINADS